METVHIESKTISLPVTKQIDIGAALDISHYCGLNTALVTKEWNALLSIITTVLWGYTHSISQPRLLSKGN